MVNEINKKTGLTIVQEKAIALILAGKSVTDTAKELEIDRSTIYIWNEKPTFKAFINRVSKEIQDEVKMNLTGMYQEAITAIQNSLKSNNESIRLKAATWLIEKLEEQKLGESDPRKIIANLCTTSMWPEIMETKLNETEYRKLLKENNLAD